VLGGALDADLALQLAPKEGERGVGVGGQVARLARGAEVGVDDEAQRVQLLQVHGARRDAPAREVRRRECGGFRLPDRALCGVVPAVELREGRGAEGEGC
jgi:hypothetical protein